MNNEITKKRIGTTIKVRCHVLTYGETKSLDGRDISVILVNPRGTRHHVDYDLADENVACFTFQGKEQRYVGLYRIEVYENLNGENQTVFDIDAFELVPHSWMEQDGIDDLSESVIDLGGSLSFGGKSAYEIAVEHGFVGTVEEWLASLKGEKGDTPNITASLNENGHLIMTIN